MVFAVAQTLRTLGHAQHQDLSGGLDGAAADLLCHLSVQGQLADDRLCYAHYLGDSPDADVRALYNEDHDPQFPAGMAGRARIQRLYASVHTHRHHDVDGIHSK